MTTRLFPALSLGLLLAGGLLSLAPPAAAGPSCGTPDEHLNLVPTNVWYGGGGCYGVTIAWLPPQFCPSQQFGVDRPYAQATFNACSGVVLLMP